jgi:hypothetical protein
MTGRILCHPDSITAYEPIQSITCSPPHKRSEPLSLNCSPVARLVCLLTEPETSPTFIRFIPSRSLPAEAASSNACVRWAKGRPIVEFQFPQPVSASLLSKVYTREPSSPTPPELGALSEAEPIPNGFRDRDLALG